MPITGLDVLLQLDPRRLERLKRDWHAFTAVTLHDFVFLLSRHAAGVEALSRHPQSQLLAAIVGLFHEIESCSSAEGSVDWAGMQTQLMHAAKSVTTTTTTTADCPEALAPLLVHERGADVHVDAAAAAAARRAQAAAKAHAEAYAHAATPVYSFGFIAGRAAETQAAEEAAEAAARGGTRMAPSVGTVEALQLVEAPVDRLLVCDVRGGQRAGGCRLALWQLGRAAEGGGACRLSLTLSEASSMLACSALVVRPTTTDGTAAGEASVSRTADGDVVEALVYLVTADSQSRLRLWPLNTERTLTLGEPRPIVCREQLSSLAYTSADGGVLWGGAVSGAMLSWSTTEWMPMKRFAAHTEEVSALLPLPSLELLVSGSHDHTLRLWDLNSGEPHGEPLRGHTRGVAAIAFERAASLLLSAAADRTVLVWNPFLDERLCTLKGHQHPLVSVAVAAGRIISADLSAAFRVWDAASFACLLSFSLPTDALPQGVTQATLLAAVVPDARRILATTGRLHLFEAVTVDDGVDEPYAAMTFSPRLMRVVSAAGCSLELRDAARDGTLRTLADVAETTITCICLDHSERNVFIGEDSGRVQLLNLASATLVRLMPSHAGEVIALQRVALAAGGGSGLHLLVSAGGDQVLNVSSAADGRLLCSARAQASGELTTLASSSPRALLAAGSTSGTLQLWKLTARGDAARPHALEPELCATEMTAVCFVGDRPLLLAASADGTITLCDVATAKVRQLAVWTHTSSGTAEAAAVAVTALALDSSGLLFSGDDEGGMCVWSLGRLLAQLDSGRSQRLVKRLGADGAAGSRRRSSLDARSAGVKMVGSWRAHDEEGVVALAIVPQEVQQPPASSCLLLSADVASISAWSSRGEPLLLDELPLSAERADMVAPHVIAALREYSPPPAVAPKLVGSGYMRSDRSVPARAREAHLLYNIFPSG